MPGLFFWGAIYVVFHVNMGIHITWLVIVIYIDKIAIEITLFSLILCVVCKINKNNSFLNDTQ